MTANPNLDEKTLEQLDGYWTVAVFGLDSRNGSVDKGNNADVQMLCSINRTTGDIRLVSVYRDTYLMNNTTRNTYGKLSWSYMDQGPAGNVAVLSTNLDIAIEGQYRFTHHIHLRFTRAAGELIGFGEQYQHLSTAHSIIC